MPRVSFPASTYIGMYCLINAISKTLSPLELFTFLKNESSLLFYDSQCLKNPLFSKQKSELPKQLAEIYPQKYPQNQLARQKAL